MSLTTRAIVALWSIQVWAAASSVGQSTADRAADRNRASSPLLSSSGGMIGVVIGWIQKLSGPGPFVDAGITFNPLGEHFRLTATYSSALKRSFTFDSTGTVKLDSTRVGIIRFQPTIAVRFDRLEVGAGANLQYFRAKGVKSFLHTSITGRASVMVTSTVGLGASIHIIPKFKPTDFGPLTTGVSTTSAEVRFEWFAIFRVPL